MGDLVKGVATKFKDKYDNRKCRVIEILTHHYKVVMLEGPAKNERHKFAKWMVLFKPAEPEEAAEPEQADESAEDLEPAVDIEMALAPVSEAD